MFDVYKQYIHRLSLSAFIKFPNSLNPYVYGQNNSNLFIDPTGLSSSGSCTRSYMRLALGILHTIEGAAYMIGGVVMGVGAVVTLGPAGLLMLPAAAAFTAVGAMELYLGIHHIHEFFTCKPDKCEPDDPVDNVEIKDVDYDYLYEEIVGEPIYYY